MSHILKVKRIMSKRKTIDAFFKKKDVSNSEFRTSVAAETNVVVEINVDISIPNEHPFKCSRIQSKEIIVIQDHVNKYVNFLSTNKMNPTSLSHRRFISTCRYRLSIQ